MKAVIQKVTKASVSVNGEIISSIGNGLCVLIGIKTDDILADAEYINPTANTKKLFTVNYDRLFNLKKTDIKVNDDALENCVIKILRKLIREEKIIGQYNIGTCTETNVTADKILNLKIFDNDTGKRWAASVMDKDYEILCISQFTLYHIIKGKKLDFHKAMPAALAELFYKNFLLELGRKYKPELIKDGQFGAMMQVSIENNGPVTLEIESPTKDITSVPI